MESGMSSARRRRFGLEASRGMLPLLALQVIIEYGHAGASRPPVTVALLAVNSLVYLRPGALGGVLPSLARVSFNPQLIIEEDVNCDNTQTVEQQQPSDDRQTVEHAPLQETDPGKETHVSEAKTLTADADGNLSSSQQTGEYNELLRQYYELEEKSRNILEQLQQTNYSNYQSSGYASTTQQQQVPVYSATVPDPYSSTTQSSCCNWNVPLVSVSCCSAGQPSGGSACTPPTAGCSVSLTCDQCPGATTAYPSVSNFMQVPTMVSTNDDQVDKAAMMTAEAAFNFMRSTISGQPSTQGSKSDTGKEESTNMGMNPNLDSDLAALLNSWYAAGFYTCRYLMLQSTKNSRP